MSNSARCVHDFTAWLVDSQHGKGDDTSIVPEDEQNTVETVKAALRETSKKWCFQLERGEGGRLHFQGRLSLKVKKRSGAEIARVFQPLLQNRPPWHFSLTSTACHEDDFYASKSDTRVSGPWRDTDPEPVFFPATHRDITLLPHQEEFFRIIDTSDRQVNVWYDHGHGGKSKIVQWAEYHNEGYEIPVFGSAKELLAATCSLLSQRKERNPKRLFIDIPCGTRKDEMRDMFLAVEKIKSGKAVDLRHRYQEWRYEPPQIWVFCNTLPPAAFLTGDRWRLWCVDKPVNLSDPEPTRLLRYRPTLFLEQARAEGDARTVIEEQEDYHWKALKKLFKDEKPGKPQKAVHRKILGACWGVPIDASPSA